MINYTIHQATMRNLDIIAPLFNEYRKLYGQKDNIKLCVKFLSQRQIQKQSVILFAFDEHKKLCCGFVQLYVNFCSIKAKPFLMLNDIFIDKNYINQGIEQLLFDNSIMHAKTNNFYTVKMCDKLHKNNINIKINKILPHSYSIKNKLFDLFWY